MALERVWAVDPAVSRLAVAFAPVDGGPVEVRTLRTDSEARDGQRLTNTLHVPGTPRGPRGWGLPEAGRPGWIKQP